MGDGRAEADARGKVEPVEGKGRWGKGGKTDLVEGVSAFWKDVGLLAREPEAEAEGFEADGALVLVVGVVAAGYDGEGCGDHGCEGVCGVVCVWVSGGGEGVCGAGGVGGVEGV